MRRGHEDLSPSQCQSVRVIVSISCAHLDGGDLACGAVEGEAVLEATGVPGDADLCKEKMFRVSRQGAIDMRPTRQVINCCLPPRQRCYDVTMHAARPVPRSGKGVCGGWWGEAGHLGIGKLIVQLLGLQRPRHLGGVGSHNRRHPPL